MSKLLQIGQMARFGIVGLCAMCVHLVVAWGVMTDSSVSAFAANLCGFAVAFCVGWAGHHWFTFKHSDQPLRSFGRYGVVAVTGFFVNTCILAILIVVGATSREWSVAISVLIMPALTYIASAIWAFSKG
jgi:putative flippase GtrA